MPLKTLPSDLLDSIRKKLLSKDKSLEREQKNLVAEDPYMKEGRVNDNAEILEEVALEDVQKNVNDLQLDFVKKFRIQIQKALAAIKIGRYGTCEVCGKPIDKARLEAYPEATTCIDCATDISQIQEIKES